MKPKVFVTGCAGFIGSHYCEALLRQGYPVIGLDNFNNFYDPNVKENNVLAVQQTAAKQGGTFVLIRGDIRDQGLIQRSFLDHKPAILVHLAAMAGVRSSLEKPALYSDVNNTGTVVVLEGARQAGIVSVVFASSSSVYGNGLTVPFSEEEDVDNPVSHYAATKRAGEIACRVYHNLYGLTIACLRFFTVYGPRQRPDLAINKFTHAIIDRKTISVFGDGTKRRDFTYIDDIVDGLSKAMLWTTKQPRPAYDIFNLGESKTTSVNELIALIEAALGARARVKYCDDIPGDVQQTFANIDKAKKHFGYAPNTDIVEGINKYVCWALENRQK